MKFDETNRLNQSDQSNQKRSMPFDVYFGEMYLTEEQIENRIEAARELEDLMLFIFALIAAMLDSESVDKDYIAVTITDRYRAILAAYMGIDEYLDRYISEFSNTFIKTTFERIGESWYLSADRATFIAENESNNVFSHDEYEQAVREGKAKKEWVTMRDGKVRHTHKEVDGRTIPIGELFAVGDSLMGFPRDTEYAASAKEVISCRCSIKYL